MLQLKIIKGPVGEGQAFPLVPGRTLTIGRAETCEVRLPSAGVSKTHCRLTALSGSRAEIEDLGSSNGTFVNGLLVKKHPLKPGDKVTLSDFILAVGIEAPKPVNLMSSPGLGGASFETPMNVPNSGAPSIGTGGTGNGVRAWVEANIYPWADSLAARFDLRILIAVFFVTWSLLIVVLTVSPFADRANNRVREQSIEVAKLYARQLVRINQQAIIDQKYRDLVAELDSWKGQTPGLIESLILDATKGQVLAPVDQIGRGLPNEQAIAATGASEEKVQFAQGLAYVSAPIKVGSLENGRQVDKTAAVAFVVFDARGSQFSFANMLDQAVSSLLYALIASILLFVFLYRWIEGSIEAVSNAVERYIRGGEAAVISPIRWGALTELCERISSALSRGAGGGTQMSSSETDWASASVGANPLPAAAFDPNLTVIAWNSMIERLVGIRASMAIGSDISGASRDVSFESAVRELAVSTAVTPWSPATKDVEFGGRAYRITMIYGQGAHMITIHPLEGS